MEAVLNCFLLVPMAVMDAKEKKINITWVLALGICGAIFHICSGKWEIGEYIFCTLPGLFLLLLACKNTGIGKGDGFLFLAVGCINGLWESLYLLEASLILCALAALFLKLVMKKPKNYRIPFVPFVLAAFVWMQFLR